MSYAATKKKKLAQPWPWFALAFAVVAFGFWPSFLSVLPSHPTPILVHGISATVWMALPILQAWLIARRSRKLHRSIGYASIALALVVAVSGLIVIQIMILRTIDNFQLRLIKFAYIDLTGIALFVIFLGLAIWYARRRDIGMHMRLMACTAIIPMEAANERATMLIAPSLVPDFATALYASLISMEVIVAALIVAEWRLDRVRWPFPLMLAYYLIMHVTATPVAQNPGFEAFCLWYARL